MNPEDQQRAVADGLYVDLRPDPKAVQRNMLKRERDMQREFLSWCAQQQPFIYEITPQSNRKSTIRVGHPDHSIFLPGAKALFVEMKTPEGRLSPEQAQRIDELRARDYRVVVAHNALEAIQAVKRHL